LETGEMIWIGLKRDVDLAPELLAQASFDSILVRLG
jgi:hypothetical protein